MKAKTFLVTILMAVVVFAVSYERGWAVDGDAATLRVGVVSVQRIFKESKKSASLREQAQVKRDQMEAELDKLAKEIEAKKAGLKTLKEDSS